VHVLWPATSGPPLHCATATPGRALDSSAVIEIVKRERIV